MVLLCPTRTVPHSFNLWTQLLGPQGSHSSSTHSDTQGLHVHHHPAAQLTRCQVLVVTYSTKESQAQKFSPQTKQRVCNAAVLLIFRAFQAPCKAAASFPPLLLS